VEMRRKTFGAGLAASLSRLGSGDGGVPPEIYQTRVMRELETAAQDYSSFVNDLFSYQREIQFEGERHNLVLVVERFLDVDRWKAAEIVARLMRERLEQFERLVSLGLPRLVADYDLSPEAVETLERHVELLKDWMAGVLEWHRGNPRYTDAELRRVHYGFTLVPTGLGTAAARIPEPTAGPGY
jgi:germacradienol/geosmin synthase